MPNLNKSALKLPFWGYVYTSNTLQSRGEPGRFSWAAAGWGTGQGTHKRGVSVGVWGGVAAEVMGARGAEGSGCDGSTGTGSGTGSCVLTGALETAASTAAID